MSGLSAMSVEEILKELEPYTGSFPKKAMMAAVAQREAITPELLRVVETAAENPVEFGKRQNYMLHVFAMYLLAQFREKRAYPPIVRMFSVPGETPFDLAGDTVTEGLKQIFGSVYDGDPGLLQGLVEDENTNEYVRNAALDAFIVLVESGQMPREEVVKYYRSLFHGKLKRTFSQTWTGLVSSVADLPAPELIEDVRQAFADDLVEMGVSDLKWIERTVVNPDRRLRDHFSVITDAIAEMEWWASFHPEDSRPKKSSRPAPAVSPTTPCIQPTPARRTKIGRNDPCPCGSGKKYKKCCGKS